MAAAIVIIDLLQESVQVECWIFLRVTEYAFLSMSGLFHLGDTTEPSPTPTDLVLTNEQLLQAIDFAATAFERLKGYSTNELNEWPMATSGFYQWTYSFSFDFSCRQENAILNSPIHVSNGSTSYAQLLDNLPNNQTMEFDKMAQIVLKASRYLLNNDCLK